MLFVLTAKQTVFAQTPGLDPLDQPKIIYVDADADGLNIGINWEHAVNSLQDALLLAYFSDKPVEIRVAQGIYKPDRGLGIMPGDSSVSFQLINGVTIKGGYAPNLGGHRGQPDIRDIGQYKSILSGDLDADDGPGLDTVKENSLHVITSSESDATAVLDGFTITASGIVGGGINPYNHSSGMYNDKSSPTLIDCTFTGNKATERGAGMYNNNSNLILRNCTFSDNAAPDGGAGMYNDNSSPMLTNCTFSGNAVGGSGAGMYNNNSKPVLLNSAFTGNNAGMSGGGMYNEKSVPTLTNCTFTYNSAGGGGGGGLYNEESVSMLSDCTFRGNSTQGSGGGMYNNNSKPALLSCIFNENQALRDGGGLNNYNASETNLTHCIFSGNRARDGGGMENLINSYLVLRNCTFSANLADHAGGGISNTQNGHLTQINCILWDNIPDEIQEGRRDGRVGNLGSDPLFADPENGDFHLKSQGGRWDPVSGTWVVDEISSPYIDAGSPDEPVGLERFPNGGRINMGAYGGTPEASLSPQFLTQLPGRASNPSPADGAVEIDRNIALSWTAGVNAVAHNVYFGPNINEMLPVSIQQATNETQLDILDYDVTYYWRIDEVDSEGRTITGDVWTFTTIRPPKGRACFTSETNVWANGALIPISKVASGQNICGINSPCKIQEVQEHNGTFACYDVLLDSRNCISVAENHYFMSESGRWISLQNLKAGTRLKTAKGTVGIINITKRPMPYVGKVYNLKIAGSDNYLVGKDAIIARDY